MKQMAYVLSIVLSMMLWTGVARAAEEQELERLFHRAEVPAMLAYIEKQLVLEVARERLTKPDSALDVFEQKIYLQELSAQILHQQLLKALKSGLSDEVVERLLIFFAVPIADLLPSLSKLLRANERAENMDDYIAHTVARPLSPQKVKKLTAIVDDAFVVDQQAFLASAIMRVRMMTPLKFQGAYNEEQAQKLEFQILNFKDGLRSSIYQQGLVMAAYEYRDLDEKHLDQLHVAVTNADWRRFQVLMTDALVAAVTQGVSQGMTRVLEYRKGKKA